LGDASEQVGRSIGRSVVDEDRFPFDSSQRDAELFEQGLDVARLVEGRNDNGQLERRLARYGPAINGLLQHRKGNPRTMKVSTQAA